MAKEKHKAYHIDDGITQSILTDFLTCRERLLYRLNGWCKRVESEALSIGDVTHRCLELWRLGNRSPIRDIFKGKERNEFNRNVRIKCDVMFDCYKRFYKKGDSKKKWIGVEKTFDVMYELRNKPNRFRLRGKIDGVFRNRSKEVWLFETKTIGSFQESILREHLQMNFQNLFYMLAYKTMTGKTPRGVLYDLILKPRHYQGKKETGRDFKKRFMKTIEDNPHDWFHRFEVVYTREDVERFESELYNVLEDFKAWVEGFLNHYKNPTACLTRGVCTYLPICAHGRRPDSPIDKSLGYEYGPMFRELVDEGQ